MRRRVWKRPGRTFQNVNKHLRVPLIKGIFKSFNFHTDKNIYLLVFISNLLPRRDSLNLFNKHHYVFYRHNFKYFRASSLLDNIKPFNCQLDNIFHHYLYPFLALLHYKFYHYWFKDVAFCFYSKQSDAIRKNYTAIRVLTSLLSLSHFVLVYLCSISFFWTCRIISLTLETEFRVDWTMSLLCVNQ